MLKIKENSSFIQRLPLLVLLFILFFLSGKAQYKDFKISPSGDTINAIDSKNLKQGKWVISVPEIRGEPGYDAEGLFKDDKKTGVWREYNSIGDIIAVENYMYGGKDGLQQYFTYLGALSREEEWKGYNPESPYDTIPIYGNGNGELIGQKVVKAQQYSVPNGEWTYYNPETGGIEKTEQYDRGRLLKDDADNGGGDGNSNADSDSTVAKKPSKPQAILDYEKKNGKHKKGAKERDGSTGPGL